MNGSIPVTWTLDEIGAQPMFQNQNLLYNTNYSISRASTATEPTSLTRGMPASMQFPDSYAAILGKTVTISFRAYSNASNVLYVRLSSDYDADILMELTATWGTTPEGGSTTTQVIGRCTMNATNAIYKTSSTYAPVFSETFTMPSSAPSGYSYLTSLSTSLILNARPTSGTIYALRPKLEVSARATPWCNELGSYLPLSGGTLSGATTFSGTATFNSTMTVSNSTIYPSIYLEPTNYNCRGVIETGGSGDISLQIYDKASDSTNRRALVLYSATEASNIINGLKLRACVSNTWTDYIVYHRGNLHYAEELPFWGTDGEICLVPIS